MQVSVHRVLVLFAAVLFAGGCGHASGPAAEAAQPEDPDTLTRVVAELRMHLRDDTYRQPRPLTSDGRDLFAATLWKLDRMQAERALPPERWQNADQVIELGRARVLEKQRRYAEAQAAYARVAVHGGALAQGASEARDGVGRLAALAAEVAEPGSDERGWLEQRVHRWTELAWEIRSTRWEPLAREESEAWEMLLVERLAMAGQLEAAIEAGRRLAEHNRHSKFYARHLIALGDLHADAARALSVEKRVRAGAVEIDARREALIENAFSAYELASEARMPEDRVAALARIEALRADREGAAAHAP
jgi:hypothetical protein